MAKLYLKFEQQLLKEFTLSQGVVTIGRLPDNLIQIDNLAVSGHHARIFWDTDHYVVEDNNSLNGTFVNRQRVSRAVLNDGDEVLVGKHHVEFKDEWHEDAPAAHPTEPVDVGPTVPAVQETMILDTRKAKEMMEQARVAAGGAAAAAAAPAPSGEAPVVPTTAEPAKPPRERIALLTVLAGKTNEPQYHLTGKLTVIGKSEMATVRLKGWFAPKVAAQITKREGKYTVGAGDASAKLRINGELVAGHAELSDGDILEVGGVKFSFTFAD